MLASITDSGWTVLGLGGRGKLSDTPVLGGLNAERGKVGRDLGPFLRAPTPGEGGNLAMNDDNFEKQLKVGLSSSPFVAPHKFPRISN